MRKGVENQEELNDIGELEFNFQRKIDAVLSLENVRFISFWIFQF